MWADDQVEQLKRMPNVPYATIKAAEHFPAFVQAQDKTRVSEMVRQRRAASTAKAKDWSAKVSDLHTRLEELEKVVTDGGAEALAVLNEVDRVTTQLNNAQRHHDELVKVEEHLAGLEADPSGYWEEFLSKYPGLRDRQITLAQYLAERGHYAQRVR